MKRLSTTTPSGNHPWLNAVHEQRRERSVQLGIQSIDALVADGLPVTYKNIHEKSKELDPSGKGIHANTVKRNEELYAYYKEHSKTYQISQVRKKPVTPSTFDEASLRRISPGRDISNVKAKYMKLSKEELVNRLIDIEQYVAQNQKRWVASHFEKFM